MDQRTVCSGEGASHGSEGVEGAEREKAGAVHEVEREDSASMRGDRAANAEGEDEIQPESGELQSMSNVAAEIQESKVLTSPTSGEGLGTSFMKPE